VSPDFVKHAGTCDYKQKSRVKIRAQILHNRRAFFASFFLPTDPREETKKERKKKERKKYRIKRKKETKTETVERKKERKKRRK
jgi:hypothetical protein